MCILIQAKCSSSILKPCHSSFNYNHANWLTILPRAIFTILLAPLVVVMSTQFIIMYVFLPRLSFTLMIAIYVCNIAPYYTFSHLSTRLFYCNFPFLIDWKISSVLTLRIHQDSIEILHVHHYTKKKPHVCIL
jgi:hypothetical protein